MNCVPGRKKRVKTGAEAAGEDADDDGNCLLGRKRLCKRPPVTKLIFLLNTVFLDFLLFPIERHLRRRWRRWSHLDSIASNIVSIKGVIAVMVRLMRLLLLRLG
jgi:hypothetical protein